MDEFKKDPFNEEKPPKPQEQQYQQPYQQNYNYNQQNINQQGYVPPQQGGYGYQQYVPYQQMPSQGMAIASLVLGIVSILFAFFAMAIPFLFIIPIIGIILGALHKGKHLPVGKGFSTAGIVTSIIGLILPIVIIIVFVAIILSNPDFMRDCMNMIKELSPEDYEIMFETYSEMFPEWFSDAFRLFFR